MKNGNEKYSYSLTGNISFFTHISSKSTDPSTIKENM